LRLVDQGVVHEVPGGYLLNRRHLVAPAVELLAGLHGELTARIRTEVQSWSPPAALVGMFGSAARRDGDAASDVDLLVVADEADLEGVDRLREGVEAWTGNAAQVVTLTPADVRRLRRKHEPIVAVWDRELVVIAGDRRALGRPR
jgi:predicted nucleotidyltransferase